MHGEGEWYRFEVTLHRIKASVNRYIAKMAYIWSWVAQVGWDRFGANDAQL